MDDLIFLEVVTGKIVHASWEEVFVNKEGYLYYLNEDGKVVLVQWVNHGDSFGCY